MDTDYAPYTRYGPQEEHLGLGILHRAALAFFWVSLIFFAVPCGMVGLASISDQPLQAVATFVNIIGGPDISDNVGLPALWERLAAPIYTAGSIAGACLLTWVLTLQPPRPSRRTSMEGTA